MLETAFPLTSAIVPDVVRMRFRCESDVVRVWFGRGSHVVRMWFGCDLDVGQRWLRRVFGYSADSLAQVKGKWFPAPVRVREKPSFRYVLSRFFANSGFGGKLHLGLQIVSVTISVLMSVLGSHRASNQG